MPAGAVPFPFGKCRICRDKATGIHYGVATCEGCKGFFKRSTLSRGEKYRCFFGGQCEVTPQNRNRCKACRFKLCLSMGMSLEAVKMGRIPKVEKQKALRASSKVRDELEMSESICQGTSATYTGIPDYMPSDQDGYGAPLTVKSESGITTTTSAPDNEIQEMPDAGMKVKNTVSQQLTWSSAQTTDTNDSDLADSASKHVVMAAGPMTSFHSDHMMVARSQQMANLGEGVMVSGKQQMSMSRGQEGTGNVGQPLMVAERQQALGLQQLNSTISTASNLVQENQAQEFSVGNECNMNLGSEVRESYNQNMLTQNDLNKYVEKEETDYKHFVSSDNSATFPEGQVFSSTPDVSTSTVQCSFIKKELDEIQNNPSHVNSTQNPSMDNMSVKYDPSSRQSNSKPCDLNPPLRNSGEHSSFLKGEAILKDYDPESAQLIRNTTRRFERAFNALYDSVTKDKRRQIKEYFENQRTMRHTMTDPEEVKVVWGLLLKAITESVNSRIVSFCSEVPGFINICPADRSKLTKRAYLEIWLLTASEFFQDQQSYLIIGDGIFYSRATMCVIMNEIIVDKMFDFAEKLNRLILTDFEIAVLCAVQLTTAENLELDEPEAIKELNSHYLDILACVVNKNRPVKGSRLLIDLFRLIPHLVEISKLNSKVMEKASLEGPTAKLKMSELE